MANYRRLFNDKLKSCLINEQFSRQRYKNHGYQCALSRGIFAGRLMVSALKEEHLDLSRVNLSVSPDF